MNPRAAASFLSFQSLFKRRKLCFLSGMDSLNSILTLAADGVRLSVRAKPATSRPRPPRLVDIGEGRYALEISVNAPAEDGKANKAILEQLAAFLGLKKAQLSINGGASARLKTIAIEGNPEILQGLVEQRLADC